MGEGNGRGARTNVFLREIILRREVPECCVLGVMNCHRFDAAKQHILGYLASQAIEPRHQNLIFHRQMMVVNEGARLLHFKIGLRRKGTYT